MDELSSGESQSPPPPPTRPTFSSFHVEKSFGKFSTSMQFFREEKWQKPENWKLMSSREFPPKLPRLKHPHRPGLSSEFSLFAMLVSENSNWKFSFAASHRRSTRLVGREASPQPPPSHARCFSRHSRHSPESKNKQQRKISNFLIYLIFGYSGVGALSDAALFRARGGGGGLKPHRGVFRRCCSRVEMGKVCTATKPEMTLPGNRLCSEARPEHYRSLHCSAPANHRTALLVALNCLPPENSLIFI
jgi:hypothetical protein